MGLNIGGQHFHFDLPNSLTNSYLSLSLFFSLYILETFSFCFSHSLHKKHFHLLHKFASRFIEIRKIKIKKKSKMPEKENSDVVVKEPRSVVRKFLARPQGEGMGAIVRRSIGR